MDIKKRRSPESGKNVSKKSREKEASLTPAVPQVDLVHPQDESDIKKDQPKPDKSPPQKKPRRRRKWPWILLVILLIITGVLGFFAYRAYRSLHKVIQKNTGITAEALKNDVVAPEKLKGEGDGRINILVLGTGDPGHAGETLTDTIMVMSYDPKTHDAAMLGIPRDLYVKIPNFGSSKINAAYAYGEQYKKGTGAELTKKTVSSLLGMPIHYYVKVDFTALKQAVDEVGGVDVKVEETLIDPDYPCEHNEGRICGFSILVGPQHLNGSAALKYTRCRKGNCGDDYGRAKRQQQILVSLREKALARDFLTNPQKITETIDLVGDNLRTDLQLWEIERLVQIAREIDTTKITNKVLDVAGGLVKNSSIGEASVVIPTAGIGNYAAIQAFARSIFVDGYIKGEAATIQVENGTTLVGRGQATADLLKSYGYNVIKTVPADATTYKKTQILDLTGGKKPYTIQYLQNRFRVTATVPTLDPNVPSPADIRIIVGTDYQP